MSVAAPSPSTPAAGSPAPLLRGGGAHEELSGTLRFLRKGTFVAVGGVVAGNVAPALVILVARAFPPNVFGLYVSLQLMVLTVSKLATLGLDRGLAWYIALDRRQSERNVRALAGATRVCVLLALAIVCVVALGAVADEWGWHNGWAGGDAAFTVACFLALPSWCVLHLYAGALEGVLQPGYRVFINQGLVTTLAPASALALHALGVGRFALPLGLIASNLVGAVVIVWAARSRLPSLRGAASGPLDRALLAYSWPIGLMDVLAGVRLRADLWMVLALAGPLPAGVYAVMSTLPSGVRVIRQNYDPVVTSAITAMGNERKSQLPRVFSYAVHMVSSLQLVIAVVVLAFPRELLSLAGKQYVLEPRALAVLLVAHLVQGMLGLTGSVVLGYGRSRALLAINLGALVLNLVLSWIWIPVLGIFGAALAGAATALGASLATLALQVRLTGSWLYQRSLWPNAALVLCFVVAVFNYQEQLLELPLRERLALAVGCAALVLLNLWLKRSALASRPAQT